MLLSHCIINRKKEKVFFKKANKNGENLRNILREKNINSILNNGQNYPQGEA
jgi:hypothetical protein